MALRPIRVYPDAVLKQECTPVELFDDELSRLVRDMVETMHAAPGIGLAANQIGDGRRVAVVDVSVGEREEDLIVMVNPEICQPEGSDVDLEGCLSLPGITDKVARPFSIRVRALDAAGEPFERQLEGLVARAVCHEVDHLDGILFTDRLRGLRKERARRQLKRLAQEQEEAV
jgi:peptide deformylase